MSSGDCAFACTAVKRGLGEVPSSDEIAASRVMSCARGELGHAQSGQLIAEPLMNRSREPIRRVGLVSALAGLALVAAHYGLEAARMAGDLRGVFDLSLQSMVLHSPMSVGAAFRLAGLALIVAALGRSRRNEALGLAGAASTLVGFLFVGHTASHADRTWLAGLLTLRLAAVAFWFGALAPLFVVSRREDAGVATVVVDLFSRIATWWVPVILLAGAFMTLLLVDSWSAFARPYGLILIVKVLAFAVLMLLASLNK